jgi:hypothetical protein
MRTLYLPIIMKEYYILYVLPGSLVKVNMLRLLNHRSRCCENLGSTSTFLSFHFIFKNWLSYINTTKQRWKCSNISVKLMEIVLNLLHSSIQI